MSAHIGLFALTALLSALASGQDGWKEAAPRDEVRPKFSRTLEGRSGRGSLVIEADGREGLDGHWRKSFEVAGGQFYRFTGYRKASQLEWPQQSAPARILWLDPAGRRVMDDRPLARRFGHHQ